MRIRNKAGDNPLAGCSRSRHTDCDESRILSIGADGANARCRWKSKAGTLETIPCRMWGIICSWRLIFCCCRMFTAAVPNTDGCDIRIICFLSEIQGKSARMHCRPCKRCAGCFRTEEESPMRILFIVDTVFAMGQYVPMEQKGETEGKNEASGREKSNL